MARWQHLALMGLLVTLLAGCTVEQTENSINAAPKLAELTSSAASLSAVCSGCHQSGGTALVSLDGRSAKEIEGRLSQYRSDPDGSTVMHRLARGYSESEISAIADYLGEEARAE